MVQFQTNTPGKSKVYIMKSFDVFDTLIARRYVTTGRIWKLMSEEFELPNFEKERPIPDDGTRTFREIYDQLALRRLIPAELKHVLMRREIQLEIQNAYPIKENIDRVSDGDILISDMYLPGVVILQMVRAAGLTKQVTIYQSNSNKGSGIVWRELSNDPPELHLGDNVLSDFRQPLAHGIKAEIYDKSEPTTLEASLHDLGLLVREVRLRNAVVRFSNYFELATQFNLPLIFIMLEQLHRKVRHRPIVFLGRDCQLMWRINNAFYGTAYYLPFSRMVAYKQPDLAAEYISQNSPDDAVIVDISSTGETWSFMAKYGSFDVLSVIYSDDKDRPYLPTSFSFITKNSVCGQTNLLLEVMNCGDHGHLESIAKIGSKIFTAKFAEPELPGEIVAAIHRPVHDAVKIAEFHREAVREQLRIMSDEELAQKFNYFSSLICSKREIFDNLDDFKAKEVGYHQRVLALRRAVSE